MNIFNVVAGAASVLGFILSAFAAFLALRASRAAIQARDAVLIRTFGDELNLACVHAEQLVQFLNGGLHAEAALRAEELTFRLSELPYRRKGYLTKEQQSALLTAREQLESITSAIAAARRQSEIPDIEQILIVARRVAINLREVLGAVRSEADYGGTE